MRFPRKTFESSAERALAEIPAAIRALIHNVEISVKSVPGPEAGRWRGSRRLLGLYAGLDRREMTSQLTVSHLPARVILYQRNIESLCRNEEELSHHIRLTLRHELAHHFGFSDEQLRRRWPEGA